MLCLILEDVKLEKSGTMYGTPYSRISEAITNIIIKLP